MRSPQKSKRAQSAMEYLTTYSWAILVITVVLVAIYGLGLFKTSTFAPRAQPGECIVYRPQGPYTLFQVSLQGTCGGELPQYVTSFNGQTSYVTTTGQLQEPSSGTFSAWVSMAILPTNWPVVVGFVDPAIYIQSPSGKPYIQWSGSSVAANPLSLNTWTFIAGTWAYNGASTTEQIYINGVASGSPNVAAGSISGSSLFKIGGIVAGQSFNGMISNVQFYNTSLTANEINNLYIKGIGGAPLVLQNLVGWWPLNGDAKDYSGNGNNGATNSIAASSKWS